MKRSVEKEQEDPAPSTCKQKRRRLKHSLIEGGWGELNPQTREPATVEKEQQDPCYMEPTSTNIELSWSNPHPGAIPEADQVDRIFTNQEQFQESGNTVAKNDHDPPDHLIIIGGYPRVGEG